MATTDHELGRMAQQIRQELRRIEEQVAYALEALNEGGANGSLRFSSDLELAPINIATATTRLAELVAVYNYTKKGVTQ